MGTGKYLGCFLPPIEISNSLLINICCYFLFGT